MTRARIILASAALLAVVSLASGCSREVAWPAVLHSIETTYPGVERISTDSLAAWMQADSVRAPLLFDVRTKEEYDVSHLRGAVHIDPQTKEFETLDTLNRDAPIVAYCSVGYRSSELAERLEKAGFTEVYNLRGSIFRWANEGRPVFRDGERVDVVHPYNAAWGRLLREELRSE